MRKSPTWNRLKTRKLFLQQAGIIDSSWQAPNEELFKISSPRIRAVSINEFEVVKEFPYYKDIPYCGGRNTMITSKLTSKSQTTVPQAVRRALHLNPGDQIVYEITDGQVILTKAEAPISQDDPFRTFGEWTGQADEEAYANL
jgi:antitoxin PrlF